MRAPRCIFEWRKHEWATLCGKGLKRRDLLLGETSLAAASTLPATGVIRSAQVQPAQPPAVAPAPSGAKRPNILVIFGDDIGQSNISAYTFGLMGYRTPNIDRIAREGACSPIIMPSRAAPPDDRALLLAKLRCARALQDGDPRRTIGLSAEDITIAEALKPLGYAIGQFGKSHLGDGYEFLPTVHGFDKFFGSLYHLNAEEGPVGPRLPQGPAVPRPLRPAARAQMHRH
jgi:arylsulfatase